jgi:hypothetical protein
VQLFPRANKDVLRQLLGVRSVGDHSRAQGVDPIDVLPVQPLERGPIPGRRTSDIRVPITEVI